MCHRSIQVKCKSSTSTCLPLSAGVPQGSHLGPLLFNIAINSLPSVSTSSSITLFADDANVLRISHPHEDQAAHVHSLQADVDNCVGWAQSAAAKFNVTKCVQVSFSPHTNYHPSAPCAIQNTPLSQSHQHRHLGITLTSDLKLQAHIQKLTNSFRGRVFLLCHMAKHLPSSAISLLFKCYVRPTVEYASSIWSSGVSVKESTTIDKLQATAARHYLLSKHKKFPDWLTPKDELNKRCGWESLLWRRQILGLAYFHHIFHTFFALFSKFNFRKSSNPRRPTFLVFPNRAGPSFVKGFLFQYAITWNKLSEETRSLPAHKFKSQIRRDYDDFKYLCSGIPDFHV